jgi:hypothetical protein
VRLLGKRARFVVYDAHKVKKRGVPVAMTMRVVPVLVPTTLAAVSRMRAGEILT